MVHNAIIKYDDISLLERATPFVKKKLIFTATFNHWYVEYYKSLYKTFLQIIFVPSSQDVKLGTS